MKGLILKVEEWSKVRNLDKAEPTAQSLKFIEEFGETCKAYARDDEGELKDGLGDMLVVLIVLTTQLKYDGLGNSRYLYEREEDKYSINEVISIVNTKQAELINAVQKFSDKKTTSLNAMYVSIDDLYDAILFLCDKLGYTAEECLGLAYNEIKDRKGVLHNGVYIKMDDIMKNLDYYLSCEDLNIPKEWIEEYK